MDIINYNSINHYNLDDDFDNVIKFLNTSQLPNNLNARQRKRFIEKYKDFRTNDKKELFLHHLQVIKKQDQEKILQKLYTPDQGFGRGINPFYYIVQNKYLNITKAEVEKFLKKQVVYQLTFKPKTNIKKPTMKYKQPNHMWSADLIDIHRYDGYNKQHKFILTMIDNFSKQVWLRPLKNKEAVAISRVLRAIFEEQSPKMFNIDNGGEFQNIGLFN